MITVLTHFATHRGTSGGDAARRPTEAGQSTLRDNLYDAFDHPESSVLSEGLSAVSGSGETSAAGISAEFAARRSRPARRLLAPPKDSAIEVDLRPVVVEDL